MVRVLLALILSVISASDPDVPDAFLDRTPLPSCGAILQGLGDTWQPTAASHPEVGCLARAVRDGAAAELVARYTTREGGTVIYYYRSEPGRPGLEIFVDESDDMFAGRPWEHALCPDAVPDNLLPTMGGCAWD